MVAEPQDQEPASIPKDLVVFSILRESTCSECGAEVPAGAFLHVEHQRPLCLACADLDHLVYLPRGDPTLTRRAKTESPFGGRCTLQPSPEAV